MFGASKILISIPISPHSPSISLNAVKSIQWHIKMNEGGRLGGSGDVKNWSRPPFLPPLDSLTCDK